MPSIGIKFKFATPMSSLNTVTGRIGKGSDNSGILHNSCMVCIRSQRDFMERPRNIERPKLEENAPVIA